jgi:PAS domain S-box-containing protein
MINVLLVHNGTETIDSTRAYLEKRGDIRVDTVTSTKQALETIKRRAYDVIVSYYRLPEIDGIEFLAEMTGIELLQDIKSHGSPTPFILYHRNGDRVVLEDINAAAEVTVRPDAPAGELRDLIYQALIRKKAERDQVLRCELLNSILSATPLWVAQIRNGAFEWVNAVMTRSLGYEEGALAGKGMATVFPGEEEYNHAIRELALRVDERGWAQAEAELKRKDGGLVPCRLRTCLLDPKEPGRGHVLVCDDQSDRKRLLDALKESDLRYREFLNNSTSLIMKLDTAGTILFFNKHAQAFFGYSEAEIVGKPLFGTIIPSRARRDAASFVSDAPGANDSPILRISEMVERDGDAVWVAWTTRAIRGESGHITEIVCIGHDITDHEHRDRRRISTALWKDKVIAGTDIREEVFDAVLNICLEISKEGREGKQVGTAFIIGDAQSVLGKSRQLILNPLEGHRPEDRMITNHDLKENIKELAQLDGAFVVQGNGLIEAAARYITIDTSAVGIPKGLGTRHSSVAGITQATSAIGIVVSQSGGKISIFRDGQMVQEIAPAG